MATTYGNNRPLLLDIPPYNTLGFGVPNFGACIGSRNQVILNLVDEIGRALLLIMSDTDAERTQAPSINTVQKMCTMYNRVSLVLASRQVPDAQLQLDPLHYEAVAMPFLIHPVPFFPSAILRNCWLREYCGLTMVALTNMMLHTDNGIVLEITATFASQIGAYFNRIAKLIGVELLGLSVATVTAPNFIFTAANYAGYAPSGVTVNLERIDNPGQIWSTLNQDDLNDFLTGIQANLIAPNLSQYPVGPLPGSSGVQGQALPTSANAVGTGTPGSEATAAAGGSIGVPVGQSNSQTALQAAIAANAAAASGQAVTTAGATTGTAAETGAAPSIQTAGVTAVAPPGV